MHVFVFCAWCPREALKEKKITTHLLKWIAWHFINSLLFKNLSFLASLAKVEPRRFCWWSDQTTKVSFAVITGTRISPATSIIIYFIFFVLCFGVSFFCCLFSCNLTWRCSLWWIKDSHLWPVSLPQTNWEVWWEEPWRAYFRRRCSRSDMQALAWYERGSQEDNVQKRVGEIKTSKNWRWSFDRKCKDIQKQHRFPTSALNTVWSYVFFLIKAWR